MFLRPFGLYHNACFDILFVSILCTCCSHFFCEVFYNILILFGMGMNLVRLLKVCLNETSSTVRTDRLLSDMFPIKSALKQGDASSPLLLKFSRVCHLEGSDKSGWIKTEWYTSASGLC